MRIIFFADGPWAQNSLKKLMTLDYQVVLVVLRNKHSDQVLRDQSIEYGIPVTQHPDVNSEEFIKMVKSYTAEIGVSVSFNQIFKEKVIRQFPAGMINCHAGKLPYYRGRNVLNWALINDEKEIGITCHYIDDQIDSGNIIIQKTFPVTDADNYETVLNKAYVMCADVVGESLEIISKGKQQPYLQKGRGTYCSGRVEGDEFIDWGWTSRRIFNFVRAITYPGPLARSWLRINEEYKLLLIKSVKLVRGVKPYIGINGAVTGYSEQGNPYIKTGDTIIEVTEYNIQDDKKKVLRIGDRLGLNFNLMMLKQGRRVMP
jgi:methionyl-tRNA formyltransferase